MFEGYECLIASYKFEENKEAVEKGLDSSGICVDAIEIFIRNLDNFLLPSVYTFIKRLLPTM
jgi:hypothetical protein